MTHTAPNFHLQGDLPDEELQAANPLAMFLRTLLPWFNVGRAPAEDDDGGMQQQQQQQQQEGNEPQD